MKKYIYIINILFFLLFTLIPIKRTFADDKQLNLQFEKAYNIQQHYQLNGKGISIAILDTGVDLNNKELNIKNGITFTQETKDYQDLNGHGTYVAGIVGSKNTGIAPKADIYAVKVLDRNQKGNYDDIVKGIQWCIDNNIDIILMSLGGSKYSKLLDNSIQKASKYGITIVSAVGNDGISNKDTVTYPAKLSGVIGVGAINQKEKRWFKSSRGKGIDIMVPGENISSTGLNNKIITQSGTSASAAYVAGFIALMKQHKNMTNLEIENALKETATSIGNEYEYGAGIINEEKSLNYKENKSFFNKLLDSLTSFFS